MSVHPSMPRPQRLSRPAASRLPVALSLALLLATAAPPAGAETIAADELIDLEPVQKISYCILSNWRNRF